MELAPRDYSGEIASLEKLIANIQTNVYFTLTITIAILTLAVGVAGWALSVLAKNWVNDQVKEELTVIDKRILKLIRENPPIHYASGSVIVNDHSMIITGLKDFDSRNVLSLEVWDNNGLGLEKIIMPDVTQALSVKLPQINNHQSVNWSVVWVPKTMISRSSE